MFMLALYKSLVSIFLLKLCCTIVHVIYILCCLFLLSLRCQKSGGRGQVQSVANISNHWCLFWLVYWSFSTTSSQIPTGVLIL